MKVVIFGATGMVGQGVLRECLADPKIDEIFTIGRTASGIHNPKLRDLVHHNLSDYGPIENELMAFDACFFCLGPSSAGMAEVAYRQVTYGVTLAAAATLCRLSPEMTFIYVSGGGTDSSETGKVMWARVKGQTENALLRMPFKAVYMFRPGIIQPVYGARSKTKSYRVLYAVLAPVLPLFRRVLPNYILTTEAIGLAMIEAAHHGAAKTVLESSDIQALFLKAEQRRG